MEQARDNIQRILTAQELKRVLQVPDPDSRTGRRDRAVLELLGGAGLKVQELLPLRLGDIDLQISCIILQDGSGSMRMIPFGTQTRTALFAYLLDLREQAEGPGALLFPARDRGPLSRQAVWKIVRKNAVAAGISRPVSPEDLRASLAVMLLKKGADPDGVKQMLGIQSAAMKRYRGLLEKLS